MRKNLIGDNQSTKTPDGLSSGCESIWLLSFQGSSIWFVHIFWAWYSDVYNAFLTFETRRNQCFSTFEPISDPHALTLNTNLEKSRKCSFELLTRKKSMFFWTFVSTETKLLRDPTRKQINKENFFLTFDPDTNKHTNYFFSYDPSYSRGNNVPY
jgi:hypothetical protein